MGINVERFVLESVNNVLPSYMFPVNFSNISFEIATKSDIPNIFF